MRRPSSAILRQGTSTARPSEAAGRVGARGQQGRREQPEGEDAERQQAGEQPSRVTAMATTVATMPPAVHAPWKDGRMVRP